MKFSVTEKNKKASIKTALAVSFILVIADYIYMTVNKISYLEREKCIIYQLLPDAGFIFFEYFVELAIMVFIGIFIATLLEKYFSRFGKFYPANTFTAFLYASALPVCACTAIPIIETMKDKMSMKSIIAFIVAAPLLNPYIIMLSFSVLGAEYALLRIASSFVLAVSAGYTVDFFCGNESLNPENLRTCNAASCSMAGNDVYIKTWDIFKSIIPYLMAGGLIGAAIELLLPGSMSLPSLVNDSLISNIILILAGIPFYFCNGTDVLLLKPLLCSGILTGTGIAFSLTSTAICITSMFMLFRFMGKRLTFILIAHIFVITLVISQVINIFLRAKG